MSSVERPEGGEVTEANVVEKLRWLLEDAMGTLVAIRKTLNGNMTDVERKELQALETETARMIERLQSELRNVA